MFSSIMLNQVSRKARVILSASVLAFIAPVALHATPITYNLTLTETSPAGTTYSGTGLVTLDVTGPIVNYHGYQLGSGLTALQFTIDGQTFNMFDPTNEGNATFGFTNASTGGVWDVTFGETNSNGYRLTANGDGYIYFTPVNKPVSGADWTGSFTASLAPVSLAPEPGSVALLGTGLFAVAGSLFRRTRQQHS